MISVRSVYSRVYSYVSSFAGTVDKNVQTIQTVDDIV